MSRFLKEVKTLAESQGLIVVSVEDTSRHTAVVFENKFGVRFMHPFSRGMKTPPQGSRDKLNLKAELSRFARGMTHGLRIVGEK